jgi:hypothetical protein
MFGCGCECSRGGGTSRGKTGTSVSSQAHRVKTSSPAAYGAHLLFETEWEVNIPKIHWFFIIQVSALRLISVLDVCSVEGDGEKTTGDRYSEQGLVDGFPMWLNTCLCGRKTL